MILTHVIDTRKEVAQSPGRWLNAYKHHTVHNLGDGQFEVMGYGGPVKCAVAMHESEIFGRCECPKSKIEDTCIHLNTVVKANFLNDVSIPDTMLNDEISIRDKRDQSPR